MAHQYVGFGRVTGSDEVGAKNVYASSPEDLTVYTNVALSEEELAQIIHAISFSSMKMYVTSSDTRFPKGYDKLKKAHANLEAARKQREELAKAQEERDEEFRRLEALHRTAMKDVGCHGQLKGCPWNNDQLEQLRSEGWDLVRKLEYCEEGSDD
jgi:hypothetical protein